MKTFTAATAALGALTTVLIVVVPDLRFAYRAPSLHVALETAAAVIAFLAAFLVFGRFRASARLDHLALATGLGFLAAVNLFFLALPLTVERVPTVFSTWAAAVAQLPGAVTLAASAFVPRVALARPSRYAAVALGGAAATLAVIAIVVWRAGESLPAGVTLDPESAARPHLDAHSILLGVQLAAVLVFAAGALGFLRRAQETGDDLMQWLAVAATLAAFSRLNYFLYPSLYSEWVYTGDVFRLLFYLSLLIGAAREIERYWRGLARAAVLEERGRISRDLHDGLAQELAFIVRKGQRLAARSPSDDVREIIRASERALADARSAIAALTRPLDEPLDRVLAQATEEVARRTPIRLDLDLAHGVDVTPAAREHLVRIACEAVSNAARHAHAGRVRVELDNGERVRLRVVDDGVGFSVDAAPGDGGARFGLTTMKERAAALNAEFRLLSEPGRGTTVEVTLP